jgi:CheY-like chemotaxis protein
VRAKPTILCIDDEALGLQIRKIVLERAGYQVLTALDGSSGLAVFVHERIDAVVLDYAMPGMNGSEVARVMRKSKPQVPILLHSAYVSLPEDVLRMVDVYVTKGDGPEILLSKLKDLVMVGLPEEEGGAA